MLSDIVKDFSQLQEKIHSAQNILILTKPQPSYDGLAAALSLYLALLKNGKKVTICCPSDLTVVYSDLVGVDKIKKDLGGKNFVISLDYQEGAIEKVSYNIENNKFNLVIQPRNGSNWEISPDKIQFNHQAADFNLIFLIEVNEVAELNTFFPNEQELFTKIPIITINKSLNSSDLSGLNLTVPNAASWSEIVVQLLAEMQMAMDVDMATNLVKGVYSATNSLQDENVGPETFEAIASCLRTGAKIVSKPNLPIDKSAQETLSNLAASKPSEEVKPTQPPDDWLKPKIYKGSTLL